MEFDRFCRSGMKELSDNVLPFWLEYVNSAENDLFVGVVDARGVADESADLSSILLFRILWSFAASYRASGNHEYLDAAIKTYGFINRYCHDKATGYFYDRLNARRVAIEGPFSTITQAYAIYSLSEFYAIFSNSKNGDPAVNESELCEQLFTLVCRLEYSAKAHSHGVYNVYIDNRFANPCSTEGRSKTAGLLLDNVIDIRCQLHLVEAFSNLYRVTENVYICELLTELLLAFELQVFPKNPKTMTLEFDVNWLSTRDEVSFGHNMECAWILFDAAKLIDNKQLKHCLSLRMVELVNSTYDMSINISGAITAGIKENGGKDERLVWWVQTEAINALLACFELTKNKSYLSKAQSLWEFIQKQFRDPVLGEWYSELTPLITPNYQVEKVGPWRGPYHITRTCLKLSDCACSLKSLPEENVRQKNMRQRTTFMMTAG